MTRPPSPNGANGARELAEKSRRATKAPSTATPPQRGARGRFAPGNGGGPGNPFAKAVGELRSALIAAISGEDIKEIIAGLVKEARGGNVAAAREVLDRVLGRPVEADLLVRLEELEKAIIKAEEAST